MKETPLHTACLNGRLPIVQYLIEKGADIEAKNQEKKTPLHYASWNGQTNVVKYLLSKGANKNAKNTSGTTPYDITCYSIKDRSQKNIIRELLK